MKEFVVFVVAGALFVAVSGCVQPQAPLLAVGCQSLAFEQMNKLFLENPTKEFDGVFSFTLVGFKDLQTGQVEITATDAPSGISVHSHPSGICIPSQDDWGSAKILGEKEFCIFCGVNHIACYTVN